MKNICELHQSETKRFIVFTTGRTDCNCHHDNDSIDKEYDDDCEGIVTAMVMMVVMMIITMIVMI